MPSSDGPAPDARGAVGLAADIEQRLREAGDPARAVATRAYLKSSMEFAGVSLPGLRGIVRALLPRRRALARDSLVAVVTELWARPLFECRLAASTLLGDHAEALTPADAALVERLIREAGTGALVDELAPVVMGGIVERYPELTAVLDRWATDEDFWVRRAALLSLLRPLRRGEGDFDRFARYAGMMLGEREFFIRKAIGWVLRDTGRRRPDLVAALAGTAHRPGLRRHPARGGQAAAAGDRRSLARHLPRPPPGARGRPGLTLRLSASCGRWRQRLQSGPGTGASLRAR